MRLFDRKKIKVGFIVEHPDQEYYTIMPSTRLRVLDVIKMLSATDIKCELYNPSKEYDIVIFQKYFTNAALEIAKKLPSSTKIVLDININVVDDFENVDIFSEREAETFKMQKNDIEEFFKVTDYIITSSPELKQVYSTFCDNVFCLEENITDEFFKNQKIHSGIARTLLYSGFSLKAKEILMIKNVLMNLHSEYGVELILLSDKDPGLDIIPYQYIKYDQRNLPELLMRGDIKIAPRSLDSKYNQGHSFNKVAYPMSVGLPAVASPVPSYINRNVLLCNTDEEWYETLQKLIVNADLRNYYGKLGQKFVKDNFSQDKIKDQYISLFNFIHSSR